MVPLDLPALLWKGRRQRRVLGRSPAGPAAGHGGASLSAAQREEYFREGYTVLRAAVPPGALDAVRQGLLREIGPSSWPWAHNSFMMVDELLDLYVFSDLPALAAQLAGSPVHLWSDFHYFRGPTGHFITDLHTDDKECEGLLPANSTADSRIRVWVTLDDDVPGPKLINQSTVISRLTVTERRNFLSGKLKGMRPMDFFLNRPWGRGDFTLLKGLRKGDVVLHSPCLLHGSPAPVGRMVSFVCPTYAPGSSRRFVQQAGAPGRLCKSEVGLGEAVAGRGDPCYPQVHPLDPGLRPGAALDFEAADYEPVSMVIAWLVSALFRVCRAWATDDVLARLEL